MAFPIAPAIADSVVFPFPKTESVRPRQQISLSKVASIPTYLLLGEIPEGLVLVQPFQINIVQDEDTTYVVSDDLFFVYGNGDSMSDALNDYKISLSEYYFLVKHGAATNPFDQKQLDYLQTYIQPKHRRGYDAIQTNRD